MIRFYNVCQIWNALSEKDGLFATVKKKEKKKEKKVSFNPQYL